MDMNRKFIAIAHDLLPKQKEPLQQSSLLAKYSKIYITYVSHNVYASIPIAGQQQKGSFLKIDTCLRVDCHSS
jgi:hypothetical protein